MILVAGYFLSHANTRAVMNKLEIPDGGIDNNHAQIPNQRLVRSTFPKLQQLKRPPEFLLRRH